MAQLAGIDSTVNLAVDYISLVVNGYNDGIENFVLSILKQIKEMNISESLFNDVKDNVLRL